MLNPAGMKKFTGDEEDANLFFINIDARLIAAGIDTAAMDQPPSAASTTPPYTTDDGLLNPHHPQVDASILVLLLSVLGGHPLQLAVTGNTKTSGCFALHRLKERYERSATEHARRFKKHF